MADLANLRLSAGRRRRSLPKYIQTPDEQVANAVHGYLYAPDADGQDVAPNVQKVMRNIIRAHPELEDLNEIKPGLALGVDKMQLRWRAGAGRALDVAGWRRGGAA
jgi:hypothetical protein